MGVSVESVCVLGATTTSSPAVQAAHLALSFPYALRMASTPLAARLVPHLSASATAEIIPIVSGSSPLLPEFAARASLYFAHVEPPKKLVGVKQMALGTVARNGKEHK